MLPGNSGKHFLFPAGHWFPTDRTSFFLHNLPNTKLHSPCTSQNLFKFNPDVFMKKYYATIGVAVALAALISILNLASQIRIHGKHIPSSIAPGIEASPLAGFPTGNTLSSIQDGIAKREYDITYDSTHHALQSPNRRHNLRAYYRPGKLTVQNRVDSAGQNFRMQLVNEGIYADGVLIAAAESRATLHHRNDTLTIAHRHLTEEFINNQAGIRQNFVVADAPVETRQLSVRLSVNGLHARQRDTGEVIFYSDRNGRKTDRLTYSDLNCWDADGKPLIASLAVSKAGIEINVNADHAKYPVTIDPIITNGSPANADKTLEINQTSAWMGFSVSSAGDVNGDGYSDVLVGAPKYDNGQADEGAAFLYPGTAGGISLAATVLECNQAGAQMGYSVSNAGDINRDGFSDILVGAPYYDASASNEGIVMIYKGSAGGIVTNSPFLFKLDQAEANLGISVAMAGDVNGDGYSDMLAGAHQFDNGESNEGVGVVILGAPNGLGLVIFLECNKPDAMMGFAVAGAGDVDGDGLSDVMAGARLYSNGQYLEGAAFIFKGSSAYGVVTANPTVIESGQIDARLGHALSCAGDLNGDGYSDIAIGAYLYDKGSSNEGVVMIHLGSQNGIGIAPSQILESDQTEAQFGISVACAGDVNGDGYADLIAGARYYDKGHVNEGAAFIYQGSSVGLNPIPASVIESNQGDAWMGSAVASAGDVNGDGYSDVLVGSYAFDHGQKDEGSVFVWYGTTIGTNTYGQELNGYEDYCSFGQSVANAGDVNGDGFSDIIIGASGFDSGQPNSGAAYIYYGAQQGINANTVTKIEHIAGSHLLGYSVAGAGDVNGDGYDDVIIGDMSYFVAWDPQKGSIEGAALVYYGSPQGINQNTFSVIKNDQTASSFGWAVSSAGDVNGDGFDDVLVGDPNYDKQYDDGAVFVYHGSAQGINTTAAITLEGNQAAAELGFSLAPAGDINGDGFDDIVVGAAFYSNSQDAEGAAFVFHGSITGINDTATILENNVSEAWMGYSVSGAGDLNGDGFSDIVIGCPTSQAGEGATLIYYGSSSSINNNSSKATLAIGQPSYFGNAVSSAGDYNGDGYGDLVIGAVNYSPTNTGAAFMFLGSSNGISPQTPIKFESNIANSEMGTSVACAGDINGDGYSDILIGAPFHHSKGSAFLFKGNNGNGTRNNLRLYNTDLITSINHTQFPQPNFGAGLFAKSFQGRNKGMLVWETKPANQGFSKGSNNRITNSTQSTGSQNAYSSLGTMGVELKNVIDKQGAGTKVRVRVKYDPGLALTGQSYGPWRYLPAYLMGNSTAPVPEEAENGLSEKMQTENSGVKSEKEPDLATVYPNPVADRLNIDLEDKGRVQKLRILTAAGAEVYQSNAYSSFIDVSKFSEGVYFLTITRTNGSHTTRKILIRR
jgi:hypothetical protein